MKRLMARHVIVDGVDHGLCIAQIEDSGDITIIPFTEEIHSTTYVGNHLEISTKDYPTRGKATFLSPDKN